MILRFFFVFWGCFFLIFGLGNPGVVRAKTYAHAGTYASVIMDASSGQIFHAANADAIVYPASLTKMMTLYLTFQALAQKKLKLDQLLVVSAHAQRQKPGKLGLKKGERITVRQAILGLVVKSANDAAVVLAEALGKTEPQFALLMTRTAKKMGLHHTTFQNASGMPSPHQKTTAREMALLGRILFKHFPAYYNYFKSRAFEFRGVKYENHNKLLGKVDGVDGIKTGYTCASGYNLAASVVRNKRRLIVVVMGGKTSKWRDNHITQLIDTAYQAPHKLPTFITTMKKNDKTEAFDIPSLISQANAQSPQDQAPISIDALISSPKSVFETQIKHKSLVKKKKSNFSGRQKKKSFRKVA